MITPFLRYALVSVCFFKPILEALIIIKSVGNVIPGWDPESRKNTFVNNLVVYTGFRVPARNDITHRLDYDWMFLFSLAFILRSARLALSLQAIMRTITEKLSDRFGALARLGLPIVVGQIGNVVLGFADTLMVGHHSMHELAAASFVNTMFTLVVIFATGFSYGLTPVVGSLFGRGETERIGHAMKDSLAANLALSVALVAVMAAFCLNIHRFGQPEELLPLMRPYLWVNIASLPFLCCFNAFKQFFDGITDTKTPMFIIIAGNLLNIFGNWVLIYGELGAPELGLFGAGISTALSRVVMALACVAVFFRHGRYRLFRQGFAAGRASRAGMRRLAGLGFPVALQVGMETAAFSLSAIFVGWIGTTALAAHQVVITVSQLLYMISSGMAAAVAVRVSYFAGQKDYAAVRRTAYSGLQLILAIALTLSVPVFLLRNDISWWFTDGEDVCLLVSQTVIPLIAYQIGDGVQYTFANALRGIECVKPMIWIAFFAYFVVSLPLGWLLGIHLGIGLVGIWCAFPVCLSTAGLLYFLRFKKELKRMG